MGKIDVLEARQMRETWKEVNIEVLQGENRTKYIKRKQAVDLYIDGLSPKTVAEQTGMSSSEVIRLVRRCMILDENGNSKGYVALIPNKHAASNNTKLRKLFLYYPSLEAFVLGNYFGDKKYTLERNMNIRTLHSKFIEECRRIGVQDYEYPFTLKDNGYDALYTYIKQKELDNQNNAIKRVSTESKQKFLSTGYGTTTRINSITPYNTVQIDGHKIDMLYTVEVENEQGEIIQMPAKRAWLLAVIDVSTRTIIGYSLSQYENYNQYDVLQAIHNCIIPHERINFKHHGFQYSSNGGFPSLALPETEWATFDMIMLDNAKSHLAKNTLDKLTQGLKCAVNFGSVATPETRGIIERFFKTIEVGGIHRLPGTTGSNINDVKKGKPEVESVKYGITYEDICELVEYLIVEYNNSAHSGLENQTPLQVMERRIRQAGMKPYIIPPSERHNINKLTYFTEERTLRGGYSSGRKPHVSFCGAKYHAYDTQIPMDMINQKVYIEVNPADVSHVDLYNKEGVFIASLVALGEWGKRPHSLKTRQAALKRKNKNLEMNTVFTPNLSILEEELRKNAKSNRRDRTNAAILEREMGKPYKNPSPENNVTHFNQRAINMSKTYTEEEMALIDSMPLEEAYKKGLI